MGDLLRRRAMMQQASGNSPAVECPYITDGLIFWLDGIYRGGKPGKWIDLIGGKEFTLYDVTELTNGVVFSSSGYGTHDGPISTNWADETLEFAVGSMSLKNKCFLCPASASPVGIGYISASTYGAFNINIDGASVDRWSGPNTGSRISANSSYAVADGSSINKASTDHWGANKTTTTYLGCRNTTSRSKYINGTLYSLRIYSRHLSIAEMQANQVVDVARFSL